VNKQFENDGLEVVSTNAWPRGYLNQKKWYIII